MNFGEAIIAVRNGASVARAGWNGKGMSISMVKGSIHLPQGTRLSGDVNGVRLDYFESGHEGTVTRNPRIDMVNAYGHTITGWVASQTDMLADDWRYAGIEELSGRAVDTEYAKGIDPYPHR